MWAFLAMHLSLNRVKQQQCFVTQLMEERRHLVESNDENVHNLKATLAVLELEQQTREGRCLFGAGGCCGGGGAHFHHPYGLAKWVILAPFCKDHLAQGTKESTAGARDRRPPQVQACL